MADLSVTRLTFRLSAGLSVLLFCSCSPSVRPEARERNASERRGADDTQAVVSPEAEGIASVVPEPEVDSIAPPIASAPSRRATSRDQIWDIGRFEPAPDGEVAGEKELYSNVKAAWLRGDEVRAFDLLTKAIAERPALIELRILRAAVTLSGVDAGTLPLEVLGGESGESAGVSVATLLFVIAEFQRGVPERPPALVPWTGLYHPHLSSRLIGGYVSLWSHGVRPLLRNRALFAGEIEVFEDFDTGSPSLVERLLTAQALAVRGEVARARETLKIRIEAEVAAEYVSRWRALVRALDASLDALAVVPARDAPSLLSTWEKQVTELIPEASGTLLVLPARALERLEARRAGGEPEPVPAIPDAPAVRETLARASRERSGREASEVSRAEQVEMVSAFLATAMRLRDFRADSLARLRSGDRAGILSDGLAWSSGLRFVEDGQRRAEFDPGDGSFAGGGSEDGSVIPCGEGVAVWIAR